MTFLLDKKIYKSYILSFIIVFFCVLFAYALNGIYPFGELSVLSADLKSQYISVTVAFFEQLKNRDNIFITWKSGLGSNLYAIALYVMANPLSILFAFFDAQWYQEIYFFIIVVKIAFVGMCFSVYSANSKLLKLTDIRINVMLSVCYALSVFTLKASLNPMWLENIAFLPLLFLGIEKIIENKRPQLFLISIIWCFITNYYLSYMTLIFAIIYFIFYCLLTQRNKEEILGSVCMLLVYTLLSVGISMVVLYPSYLAVSDTYTDVIGVGYEGDFIKYSFKDIIFAFVHSVSERSTSGYPCVYFGILPLWLCMGYFVNKAFSIRERVVSAVIMAFFVLSLHINLLYFMWHLFRAPTGFDGRFLYGVVLFALILAGRCLMQIEYINKRYFLFMGLLLFLGANYSVLGRNNIYYIICIGVIFILLVIYGGVLLSKRKSVLVAVVIVEMFVSSYNGFRIIKNWDNYFLRDEYVNYVVDYKNNFNALKEFDKSFYRSDCNKAENYNSSMEIDYNGINHYSSLANQKSFEVMRKLGTTSIENNKVLTAFGQNKVLDSLFNIKYYGAINKNQLTTDNIGRNYYYNGVRITNSQYEAVLENENSIFYENKAVFPLMFGVDNSFKECHLQDNNYFENQTMFLNSMFGDNKQLYKKMNFDSVMAINCHTTVDDNNLINIELVNSQQTNDNTGVIKLEYKVKKAGNYFTVLNGNFSKQAIVNKQCCYTLNDVPVTMLKMENELKDLGWFEEGVTISLCYYSFIDTQIYLPELYRLDEDVFNDFSVKANKNGLTEINNENGNITARSDFKTETLVFTSISYDKGFNIYIDGVEAEKKCLVDGFLGFYVPQGQHEIVISYVSPGFMEGAIISVVSLLISVVFLFNKSKGVLNVEKNT